MIAIETQKPGPARRWPLIVIGLLAAQATGLAVMITIAVSDPSVGVEPDYYEKAVAWDSSVAADRAAKNLGWDAALNMGPLTAADRELHVNISGKDARGIDEARVHVELFHQARSGHRLEADLTGLGAGGYATRLPITRPGLWEVRITVRQGPNLAAFTKTLEVPRTQ